MAQSFEESLIKAIKKDDIKAFEALAEKVRCGEYRLGRFPVLSLLYLYKSRKILSAYEKSFLNITSFEKLSEPVEVSKQFSAKAGKCLRLYFDEVVSPLEMLLILDKAKKLKRVYPLTNPSPAVKERLKAIYAIKYSLNVKFEGENIILDRRPLSYREKKNIATICLCSVLAVTITVGVPVTTVALIPKPVEGEVTKLSQIDFSSKEEYTLKRDIVLPENFTVDKVNCTITGSDKKLIIGNGVKLGELNGKLSGLTIESNGNAVFTSVSVNAVIENITVNVSAAVVSTEKTALVAATNYGTIDGITVNVSGTINAVAASADANEELTFGGIVQNNNYKYNTATQEVYRGTIKNCKLNYSVLNLVGEAGANAAFGGVAGVNAGYVLDCTVSGKIIADSFDVAGVCVVNSGIISGCVNGADVSQTSSDTGWNPITSGIVLSNAYTVESCKNTGEISSVSNCSQTEGQERAPAVYAAGIAYLNTSTIAGCINSGTVKAQGSGDAYVGGISARSYSNISYCISRGDISATANSVYAGGILGCSEVDYEISFFGYNFTWGDTFYCISESNIKVTPINNYSQAFAGGITGYVKEIGVETQRYDEDNNIVKETLYFGGGVTNSYFTGRYECADRNSYFGNIVGRCGANIYESNSYNFGNTVYNNFKENYYCENSFNALGAAVTEDGTSVDIENKDKGANTATIDDIKNSETYKSIINALDVKFI